MYAATQVTPAVMDFIGKRMMVSQNRWVRRMWWLPQAAESGFSIAAGGHNIALVKEEFGFARAKREPHKIFGLSREQKNRPGDSLPPGRFLILVGSSNPKPR